MPVFTMWVLALEILPLLLVDGVLRFVLRGRMSRRGLRR
jgi:hypothetical protein